MKISIITCVLNNSKYIKHSLESKVKNYRNETYYYRWWFHQMILWKVKKFKNKNQFLFSSKDLGIYHAINKGIKLSTGKIIGILHSDDFYYHNKVISDVSEIFKAQCRFYVVIYNIISKKYPYDNQKVKAGKFNEIYIKAGYTPSVFIKKNFKIIDIIIQNIKYLQIMIF